MDVVDEKLLEGMPGKQRLLSRQEASQDQLVESSCGLLLLSSAQVVTTTFELEPNFRARLPSFQTASSAARDSHKFLPCPFLLSQLRMQTIKCVVVGDGAVGKASDDGPAIAECKPLAVS